MVLRYEARWTPAVAARTRAALGVLTENIRAAQTVLPVPLAVENIAALISWPEDELTDAQFLTELAERTGVLLLLDVANLHTARVNFGLDPIATLDAPLERVGYVRVAVELYHRGPGPITVNAARDLSLDLSRLLESNRRPRIMRGMRPDRVHASCTDSTEYRTDGTRHAGIIRQPIPRQEHPYSLPRSLVRVARAGWQQGRRTP